MKSTILKCAAALLVLAGATSCNNDMKYADVKTSAVSLFYEPLNNKEVKLVASNSASLLFEWEASHAEDGAAPQYEVAFYKGDDTNTPIYKVLADNMGTKPMATIPHKTLAKVCAAANIAGGETGTIKWGVIAYAGVNPSKTPVDKLNNLTLTRFEGFSEIPTSLYFAGAGTETGGSDLSNAVALNAIDAEIYEAFSELKAGQKIYFSADKEGVTTFAIKGSKLVEGDEGDGVTESGVYRITLDFGAATATLRKVDKLIFFHCDGADRDNNFEYTYVGNGVYEAEASYKLHETGWSWDPFESRYKFRMTYADGTETEWGSESGKEKPAVMDPSLGDFYIYEHSGLDDWSHNYKIFGAGLDSPYVGQPCKWSVFFNLQYGHYTHFYEVL